MFPKKGKDETNFENRKSVSMKIHLMMKAINRLTDMNMKTRLTDMNMKTRLTDMNMKMRLTDMNVKTILTDMKTMVWFLARKKFWLNNLLRLKMI